MKDLLEVSVLTNFSPFAQRSSLFAFCSYERVCSACLVAVASAGLLLVSGCSTTDVRLNVGLSAGAEVNPSVRGRASPVLVRIYQLKNNVRFNGADFLSLYDKDKDVLGDELIAREEQILEPGKTLELELPASPEMRFVAVFAGFRDVGRAQWRDQIAFDDELRHSWFRRKIKVPVGVAVNGQQVRVELFKSDDERSQWISKKLDEGTQMAKDKSAEAAQKKGEAAAGKALGKMKMPF